MRSRDLYTLRKMQTLSLSRTYPLRLSCVKLRFLRPSSLPAAARNRKMQKIAKPAQRLKCRIQFLGDMREIVRVQRLGSDILEMGCSILNDLCRPTSAFAKPLPQIFPFCAS